MKYSIESDTLMALGDAVRHSAGTQAVYTPAEMAEEIRAQAAVLDDIVTRTITEFSNSRVNKVKENAFQFCTSLVRVDIPAATALATSAFSNCTALTFVDMPAMTYIRNLAFQSCAALETVIIRGTAVCTLENSGAFSGSGIARGTGYVYVPAALVDSYKAANNWSTYGAQIRAIEDWPDIIGG